MNTKQHKRITLFVILLLLLAACGGSETADPAPADDTTTEDSAAEDTATEDTAAEEEMVEEEMAEDAEPRTLVVSTWGFNMDAIEENIKIPFEEMYNVEIIYDTGNNSDRLAKLETRGEDSEIDVVHFAGAFTFRAKDAGLLQPIDPSLLSNYDDLYDWAKDPLGDNVGVGYSISSYMLIYRTDKISEPVTSWNDLLREDVAGFVSVPDLATTFGPATIVMLANANGGDINNTEPAWDLLPQLADQLVTTYRRSSELTTLIQEEEVWMAPYSSFALGGLLDTGLPLQQIIPAEGVPASPSVVSIVAGSKNVDLAHKYIDFLISHEVQLAQAEALIDSPTNTTVVVSDDVANLLTYGDMIDALIFMDEAQLAGQQEDWLTRWNDVMLQQ